MLKSLTIVRERITDATTYPFTVPAIATLSTLTFSPARITFFTGENGSGKSTLLEAIAQNYGLGREGGNRNFQFSSTESNDDTDPLARALRLSFDVRTGEGFFFRAESLFNLATQIDELGLADVYGGKSIHAQSHGEGFFTVLTARFRRGGLFLLDEPEAALSPVRQLALLTLLHETIIEHRMAQFIISTHSPILLGYPGAQILGFDSGRIAPIAYEDTTPYRVTRRFLNNPGPMLQELFAELPFDEE